jgi:rRNA-processing protein FCF1
MEKGKGTMEYKIVIDADSIIYKACYRHQEPFNAELTYFEFCAEIGKITGAFFADDSPFEYEKGDKLNVEIVLSPKVSFRNELYTEYKAKRKRNVVEGIKDLKKLVLERLNTITTVVKNVEADDIVIRRAYDEKAVVAAIDKDVINACPTATYDYNKFKWGTPNSQTKIERWYLTQALMGDSTDNIPGAPGVGKVTADKIINDIVRDEGREPNFWDIVPHFDSEMEARLSMLLVRMDMWDGKKVNYWKPKESEL